MFVSALLLVTAVSAGLEVVMAQPRGGPSRPASDTGDMAFELLGEHIIVNTSNVTYADEEDGFLDIYFACSSTRGPDPLRLRDPGDIRRARSYFDDEKRSGRHFARIGKYAINIKNIAFIEIKDNTTIVNFNSRIMDAFAQVTLSGADAEEFRKKRRAF